MRINKDYLGDSVYVEEDELHRLHLTTENGLPTDPSNEIILEADVLLALLRYVERIRGVKFTVEKLKED